MREESLWEFPGKTMFANDHITGETAHGERILFKNINEIRKLHWFNQVAVCIHSPQTCHKIIQQTRSVWYLVEVLGAPPVTN